MRAATIHTIASREARAGQRNKWFLLYTALFVVLSIALSSLAMSGSLLTGEPGFGRTSAALINLMLLIVPLMGLTIGAQTLVSERQDRSLDYLLAQPVSPREVYIGKYIGAALSLVMLLVFGFGCSAVVIALRGGTAQVTDFLLMALLTIMLGLAMLSVGYAISSFTAATSAALGIAVSIWLLLVIVGDLGLMGSSLAMDLSAESLLTASLANPLDVYKLVVVQQLQTSLNVLGPAGTYALDRLGNGLTPFLLGLLALWIVVPLPIGYWLFKRADFR
jgi:Cu-processing system permease protein